jgi:hypothetical protein
MNACHSAVAFAVLGAVVLFVVSPCASTRHLGDEGILSGFSLGENAQAAAVGDMVAFVLVTLLPPTRQPGQTYTVMAPLLVQPSSTCSGQPLNSTGPVFAALSFEFLGSVMNGSTHAMATSAADAANALGGQAAAADFSALSAILGDKSTAARNYALATIEVEVSCLHAGATNDTVLVRVRSGAGVYRETEDVALTYLAATEAFTEVLPAVIAAGAGCFVGNNAAPVCVESIPAVSTPNMSLADLAPAIQAAASECETIRLCARAVCDAAVNVHGCHYAVGFQLQTQYLEDQDCVYF